MTLYGYPRDLPPDEPGDDSPAIGASPGTDRFTSSPVPVSRGESTPADGGAHLPTQTSLPEVQRSGDRFDPERSELGRSELGRSDSDRSGSARSEIREDEPGDATPPGADVPAQGIFGGGRRRLVVIGAGAVALIVAIVSGASAAMLGGASAQWLGPLPASPSAGASATAAPVETVTLSGVGDVIMGTLPHSLPPAGGAGIFDPVKVALASDLVMGNLETPLSENTGRVKCQPTDTKCFQFNLPPEYADNLRDGGFGLLNLANNHTGDMGPAGLRNTRQALESRGIRYTGAPDQITHVDIRGVDVAVIGFAPYPTAQNLLDIDAAKQIVAKAAAESDIVVVQMQGGDEGAGKSHTPNGPEYLTDGQGNRLEARGDLRRFAHVVIDAGADVIFGHGPHVMRGMEFYHGRLIAYSLGNFCGYRGTLTMTGVNGVSGILRVTLHRDGSWVSGTLVATKGDSRGLPILDPLGAAWRHVDRLSVEDFSTTAARIGNDGAIAAPTA